MMYDLEKVGFELLLEAPEIHRIRVPLAREPLTHTNCYLIHDNGEWLLVDTGIRRLDNEEGFAAALEALGVDLAKLSVFLTHLHPDHVGLLDSFVDKVDKVYLSERELDRLAARPEETSALVLSEGASKEDAELFLTKGVEASDLALAQAKIARLVDGDEIPIGGERAVVSDTRGHSHGHLSLYLPSCRCLLSGDHIIPHMSSYVELAHDGSDGMEAYFESLTRVLSLDVELLLPSHGDEMDGLAFRDRVEWLGTHRRKRLDELEACIRANPGNLGLDAVKAATWSTPERAWGKILPGQRACIIHEGLSSLRYLEYAGRIRCIPDEQGMRRYYPYGETGSIHDRVF